MIREGIQVTPTDINALPVGSVLVTPKGDSIRIARAKNGLGIWNDTKQRWDFGGWIGNSRTLTGCRHYIARMFKVDYTSPFICEECRADAEGRMTTDDREEVYECRCPICGNTFDAVLDGRQPDDATSYEDYVAAIEADEDPLVNESDLNWPQTPDW